MKENILKKYAPMVKYTFAGDTMPISFSEVRIELEGQSCATVEGCKGIAEYDCDSITLNGKPKVIIRGASLELRSLDDGRAHIRGKIKSVEYLTEE